MKTIVSILALAGVLCVADLADASGYGQAVVQQNIVVRQRQRIQPLRSFRNRQRVVVKQQFVAPVYAAPIVQQVYAQPVYAAPVQQIVVPQVQSYVAPQVFGFSGGCAAGICNGAAAVSAGCF